MENSGRNRRCNQLQSDQPKREGLDSNPTTDQKKTLVVEQPPQESKTVPGKMF